MLRFMYIPDMGQFMNLVERSRGKVLLQLPDRTQCDLKSDASARALLRAMVPGRDGLCIRLSDPGDTPAFIRYMYTAAHAAPSRGMGRCS